MRGEVLHYDAAQGFGFISGADGQRYSFTRESLRREAPLAKGTAVEFSVGGGQARDVFVIRAQPGEQTPAHFGRQVVSAQADRRGGASLWSYFRRSLTTDYARFSGRARRKEYWGFALLWFIVMVILSAGAIAVDSASGNMTGENIPLATIVVVSGFMLLTMIPWLAVTVRRVHDIGLSGWFVLLSLIPYIGSLIVFVFTVIPSQRHENRWGPVPAGVRIPPPFTPPAETAPV